eukprot:gene18719-biopygen17436
MAPRPCGLPILSPLPSTVQCTDTDPLPVVTESQSNNTYLSPRRRRPPPEPPPHARCAAAKGAGPFGGRCGGGGLRRWTRVARVRITGPGPPCASASCDLARRSRPRRAYQRRPRVRWLRPMPRPAKGASEMWHDMDH